MENFYPQQDKNDDLIFEPIQAVAELLGSLSSREAEVLNLRFGLDGSAGKTLEQIGQNYQITRERVRQIERNAVNNIKNNPRFNDILGGLIEFIKQELLEHGGLKREDLVITRILNLNNNADEANKNCLFFIVRSLLPGIIDVIKTEHLKPSLILDSLYQEIFNMVLKEVVELLAEEGSPLGIEDIKTRFKSREAYKDSGFFNQQSEGVDDERLKRYLESYMHSSHKVKSNPFGHWGLREWKSITPKRMNEKIYLVLSKQGKPTHYHQITDLINEANFDKKKAHPPTIHNELISDERFVLVGRGIYALKEWGFKEGMVADVLYTILKEKSQPMDKDELVEEVLKQRIVQKNTVYIALADKNKFKKIEGNKYWIMIDERQK